MFSKNVVDRVKHWSYAFILEPGKKRLIILWSRCSKTVQRKP